MSQNGFTQVDLATIADEITLYKFIFSRLISKVKTISVVRVLSCTNTGGVEAAGTVDLQILVNIMVADGSSVPHGTISGVPYCRYQGGKSAIILDPEEGDIGIALFCDRDISVVKANPAQAVANEGVPPGSWRKFSYSDGLYIGGVLNGTPDQFIQFSSNGINIQSPGNITINGVTFDPSGNINSPATITANTDVVTGAISLSKHAHSGVQSGSGTSGPPVA